MKASYDPAQFAHHQMIVKYRVKGPEFKQSIPADARFLSVQVVHRVPFMWFVASVNASRRSPRTFKVFKTRQIIKDDELAHLRYLGTYVADSPGSVSGSTMESRHVFEVIP